MSPTTAWRRKRHQIPDDLRDRLQPLTRSPFAPSTRRLAKLTLRFLDTPHYEKAIDLEWDAIDLFGVPNDLRDQKPRGLLPVLAWTRLGGRLRGIDRDGAKVVVTPQSGQPSMRVFRPHPCPPGTVPFWESAGLEREV